MIRSYAALLRRETLVLLFGIGCAFLSSPGQTFFISQFIGAIGSSLGLGAATLGSLYLAATLGAAAMLPFTGHWLDRIDLRRYTLLVAGGLAMACGLMAVADGPIGLFLGFLFLRLTGQGLMTHVAVTSVARYFDRHRGRAMSLVGLGFPIAEGMLPVIAVSMIAALGWRMSYGIVGAIVLAVAAPVLLRLVWRNPVFTRPASWQESSGQLRVLDGLRIVVRTSFFWYVLPILLFMPFTSTALIFHIQAIATTKGWSSELVAVGFTAFAVAHAAGLLLSGGLIDRFGAPRILPLTNVPVLIGIASLGAFEPPAVLVTFLGAMGLSSGLVQTTVTGTLAEVYGVKQLGTIRSFVLMLMVGGTALGPAVIGFLLDAKTSIGAVAGLLVVAGLAGALLGALGVQAWRVSGAARHP